MGNRKERETPDHAEGQHGNKTHERLIEQLQSGPTGETLDEKLAHDRKLAGEEGARRLVEDREQHDEAEKNSERNRLFKELDRRTIDDGPIDPRSSMHGVLEHREHRADYRERDSTGLRKED